MESTFPSPNVKKSASERFWTLSCWKSARGCGANKIWNSRCKNASQHFWKLRCSKSARCCGAKHIWKSNVLKTEGLGLLFEVRMWFGVAGARDSAPCQKWVKREGFVAIFKARGTFEQDLERYMSPGPPSRRNRRDISIRDVRRSGSLISCKELHFGASDLQVC